MGKDVVDGTGFLNGKTERLEKELSSELSDQSIMWPPQEGFVNNESQRSN